MRLRQMQQQGRRRSPWAAAVLVGSCSLRPYASLQMLPAPAPVWLAEIGDAAGRLQVEVNVLAKGLKKDQVSVTIEPERLRVAIANTEGGCAAIAGRQEYDLGFSSPCNGCSPRRAARL
jgi:hypothetical protein